MKYNTAEKEVKKREETSQLVIKEAIFSVLRSTSLWLLGSRTFASPE